MRHTLILITFLLYGCAQEPQMTYDEMTEAYRTAETQKEKDTLKERIADFEQTAQDAAKFYEGRDACSGIQGVRWFCTDPQITTSKKTFSSVEELVKEYNREKHSCGCFTERAIQEYNQKILKKVSSQTLPGW